MTSLFSSGNVTHFSLLLAEIHLLVLQTHYPVPHCFTHALTSSTASAADGAAGEQQYLKADEKW
jgi:hypothetical protein